MSRNVAQDEQSIAASELNVAGRISEARMEFFPDLIEKRIKPNLELVYAETSALTHLMDKLIKDNSARSYPTVSIRDRRFPSESPLTDEPRPPSETLALEPIVTAGYSSNKHSKIFSRQYLYNSKSLYYVNRRAERSLFAQGDKML